ncbi:hemerythrin domain-containing protein [Marinobacterium lutimaris]|uniref:Hemerythrin-like metal-binding domain protein n=1 Tax=Marinobacterium lutimaris TaxID=568106 RepID=A0A1H6DGW4_9GAMM|nr:hemerythrin domain-containing protein [Marinobacterium lutimaris]SEG84470.1 hemerythrin-like metal-binding domain protein [Marinobacterium lutimaris]
MLSAAEMLSQFENCYQLGDASMDKTHQESLRHCHETAASSGPQFAIAFQRLLDHTQAHFDEEEQRMLATRHGSYKEHRADHQRILGDMTRFNERVQAGRGMMAKAWLTDSLLAWFDIHAKTMDSALASDLKADA